MSSPHTEPSPERIPELFHRALDLPPDARAAFLDDACAGDPALRDELAELLRSTAEAEADPRWALSAAYLEATASATDPAPSLDRYRLGARLGAGGMGVVYRAQRSDGAFEKEVAIKMVPWAAGDEKLIERFEEERAILARLEHPNIARLLDGGVTSEGLPYLVMELADGVPIDEYVRVNKPSLREMVELFRRICDAVSYAHRNLIVHRDLKPSNILVAPNGEPKLLDFGVAKLLDKAEAVTRTRALTPEYASPEQLTGAPVSTASDVYSLGVVFYELIAGRAPYRATTSVMDLASVICNEPPLAPGPEFADDLANIVLMALRKEPERRYASAAELSEDLRRWLEGYPVSARPDTRGYRLRKFLGRNKLAVASAALLLLTIAGGVAATLRQAAIANRRFNDVRKLANSYLLEFHDAIQYLPGSIAARQLVVKRGLEYLDSMARERGGDRALTSELAAGYTKIGNVQGAVDASNLGDFKGALGSYRRASMLYEEALAGRKDADLAIRLSDTWARASRVLQRKGEVPGAEALELKAVALVEAYAPVSTAAREVLTAHYGILAEIEGNPNFPNLGHTEKALELYKKSFEGTEARLRARPEDHDLQMRVSTTYNQLAQMQQALDHGREAIDAYKHGLEMDELQWKREPNDILVRQNVAVTCNNIAQAYSQLLNSPREAQPYNERALALAREIVRADPKNVQATINLAFALNAASRIAGQLGDHRRALDLADESVAGFEAAGRISTDAPRVPSRTAYQTRADELIALGNGVGAMADVKKQLEIDDFVLRLNPGDPSAERNQAIAWAQTGLIHMKSGEWRPALTWYEKAEAVYVQQQRKGTFIPRYNKYLESVRTQAEVCRKALAKGTGAAQ